MKHVFFAFCLTIATTLPLFSTAKTIDAITTKAETVTNLSVTQSDQTFQLKWIGANEKFVSHFYIEKSFDGVEYKQAGIVFSNSGETKDLNYQFPDKNNSRHKKIFYRLRIIDVNGNSTFSEVKYILTH